MFSYDLSPSKRNKTIYSKSCSFRLKCIILGIVLRPLHQPKPHFPSPYGLHILGAVRGKQYCELVEYEVHTSTESVCLRENVTILMKFIQQHLQQGFLQEFTEHSFSAGNFSRNHKKNQDFQSKIEILRPIVFRNVFSELKSTVYSVLGQLSFPTFRHRFFRSSENRYSS